MNKTETMKELEALGNERHRATFARHGVTGDVFGVPYADLYKVQKRIGIDQKLAEELWATGNHDARVLAAFIADPAAMKASVIDRWAKTAGNQVTLDSLAGLAAKTESATKIMERWMASKGEWIAAAGWHVLAGLCSRPDAGGLADEELGAYVERIEREIHGSENRVRYSMNAALIAIGGRGGALEKKALAAARRIGKVDVDHGETACKTPDAVQYIQKMADRASAKKSAPPRPLSKKKVTRKSAGA